MSKNGAVQARLRDRIINNDKRPYKDVEVPEWQVTVRVRGFSAGEKTEWEKANTRRFKGRDGTTITEVDPNAVGTFRQRLVILCTFDPETGERVFSSNDVDVINQLSASSVERIVNIANDLNGVSQREFEELEGNSEMTSADVPYSASRLPSDEQSVS